jgi:hypothetical protein
VERLTACVHRVSNIVKSAINEAVNAHPTSSLFESHLDVVML